MTKNQKWLKGLVGGDPKPKTAARRLKRGPNYVHQFAVAHETKRQALLNKRQEAERAAKEAERAAKEAERAAEAAAKAAKKGAK